MQPSWNLPFSQTLFNPAVNAAFQEFRSPILDVFFQFISVLGYPHFFILVLAILYWTWDKRRAFQIIALVVLSGLVEHWIKEFFQMPRPFQLDPQHVRVLDVVMRRKIHESGIVWSIPAKTSYGFPSGHVLVAVCFWGALAREIGRRKLALVPLAIILLTPLSRLYLGVHFLGDVLGGMLIGAALLGAYVALVHLESRTDRLPSAGLMRFVGFAAPLALFLVAPDPESAQRASLLIGFMAGHYLAAIHAPFCTEAPRSKKVLRVVVGLAVFGILFLPLGRWLNWGGTESLRGHPITMTVCHYGLLGWVTSLVLPWVFTRTGLARTKREETENRR